MIGNENINYNIKGKVEYVTFKVLDDLGIKHAFFTRKGGVSNGIYNSLNLRNNSLDDKVKDNIDIIKKTLDIDKLYKTCQNHTDNILKITKENKNLYEVNNKNKEIYDAIITNVKNIPISVTTADCIPVIVYDKVNKVIGCIHSGWKSTVKQIVKKTLIKMNKEYNTSYKNVIVCIGPSIRKCHFTSKDIEFKNIFTNVWKEEDYITKENDTYHIDLVSVISKDLLSLGVIKENIFDCGICTKCNVDKFFSYRQSTQNKDNDYGVQINIISV